MDKNLPCMKLTSQSNGMKKDFILTGSGKWQCSITDRSRQRFKQGKVKENYFQFLLGLLQEALQRDEESVCDNQIYGVWQFDLMIGGHVVQSECGPIQSITKSAYYQIDYILTKDFGDFPIFTHYSMNEFNE